MLRVDVGELLGGEEARPDLRSLRRSLGLTLDDLAREVHVWRVSQLVDFSICGVFVWNPVGDSHERRPLRLCLLAVRMRRGQRDVRGARVDVLVGQHTRGRTISCR